MTEMTELLLDLAEPDCPPADLKPEPARATRRVLHVINGEHYSGAERVQDLLALRLPDEGFLAGFACLKADRFPALRQSQQAPLADVPMRSRFDTRAVSRLAQWIRDEHYELVHAHTPRSGMIGRLAAWRAGVPFVYHVHSPTSRDSTRRWRNRFNVLAEGVALLGARRVVAVSQSLGRHMRRSRWLADRVVVVPNGVPEMQTAPKSPPAGLWTLGTVALFRPRKGIEVLLEALAKLKKAGANVQLRAVGGFETPEYERQIHQLAMQIGVDGGIQWTGFTSDVPAELRHMDLLVLPSLFGEGLPMVVLEAMAAGVPVVATSVEGVPEAVRDRIDGVLAKPGSADSLADAIGALVRGEIDWQQVRTSALARHAEKFSDRAMAAGVARVYREVLDCTSKKSSYRVARPEERRAW